MVPVLLYNTKTEVALKYIQQYLYLPRIRLKFGHKIQTKDPFKKYKGKNNNAIIKS